MSLVSSVASYGNGDIKGDESDGRTDDEADGSDAKEHAHQAHKRAFERELREFVGSSHSLEVIDYDFIAMECAYRDLGYTANKTVHHQKANGIIHKPRFVRNTIFCDYETLLRGI